MDAAYDEVHLKDFEIQEWLYENMRKCVDQGRSRSTELLKEKGLGERRGAESDKGSTSTVPGPTLSPAQSPVFTDGI